MSEHTKLLQYTELLEAKVESLERIRDAAKRLAYHDVAADRRSGEEHCFELDTLLELLEEVSGS